MQTTSSMEYEPQWLEPIRLFVCFATAWSPLPRLSRLAMIFKHQVEGAQPAWKVISMTLLQEPSQTTLTAVSFFQEPHAPNLHESHYGNTTHPMHRYVSRRVLLRALVVAFRGFDASPICTHGTTGVAAKSLRLPFPQGNTPRTPSPKSEQLM